MGMDEFDDFDDGLDEDDEEDWGFECGEDVNGGCSLAGSEECDFECPNRDAMIARLDRKHKKAGSK